MKEEFAGAGRRGGGSGRVAVEELGLAEARRNGEGWGKEKWKEGGSGGKMARGRKKWSVAKEQGHTARLGNNGHWMEYRVGNTKKI